MNLVPCRIPPLTQHGIHSPGAILYPNRSSVSPHRQSLMEPSASMALNISRCVCGDGHAIQALLVLCVVALISFEQNLPELSSSRLLKNSRKLSRAFVSFFVSVEVDHPAQSTSRASNVDVVSVMPDKLPSHCCSVLMAWTLFEDSSPELLLSTLLKTLRNFSRTSFSTAVSVEVAIYQMPSMFNDVQTLGNIRIEGA